MRWGQQVDAEQQQQQRRTVGLPVEFTLRGLLACGPAPTTSVTESSDTLCCKLLRRQSGKPSTPGKHITSKSSVCGLGSKALTSSVQKKSVLQRLSSPERSCDSFPNHFLSRTPTPQGVGLGMVIL